MTSIENASFAINRLEMGIAFTNKNQSLNCYMDALESLQDAICQLQDETGEFTTM